MQVEKRCFVAYNDDGDVLLLTSHGQGVLVECEDDEMADHWIRVVFPRLAKGRLKPRYQVFRWADYVDLPHNALSDHEIRDFKAGRPWRKQ